MIFLSLLWWSHNVNKKQEKGIVYKNKARDLVTLRNSRALGVCV